MVTFNAFDIDSMIISFFSKNTLLRYVVLVLITLGFRFLLTWLVQPALTPEAYWQALGSRIAAGSLPYIDVIDNTSPLSAFVYGFTELFGQYDVWAARLLAALIVCFQAIYFNRMLLERQVVSARNTMPAFWYVTFAHLSYDMVMLTPMLIGLTFLLPALDRLLYKITKGPLPDEGFLLIGIFTGLASLSHLSLIGFLPVFIVALYFYTDTQARQYTLVLMGAILPFIIISLVYYWLDGWGLLVQYLVTPYSATNIWLLVPLPNRFFWLIIPLLTSVVGSLYLYGGRFYKLVFYQRYTVTLFVFWLAAGYTTILFSHLKAPFQFIIFVPALSYFASYLFSDIKKRKWLSEFVIWLMLVGLWLPACFPLLSDNWSFARKMSIETALLEQNVPEASGSKVLALGYENAAWYKNNSMATPFLHPAFSQSWLEPQTYEQSLATLKAFEESKPEILIDNKEQHIARLFRKMPVLARQYQKEYSGKYVLKEQATSQR